MAARLSGTWARVVATAGFDAALINAIGTPVACCAEPASAVDEQGRLRAEPLTRAFAAADRGHLTLVLTPREVAAGNRAWVFGYADRRRGVAVVSSCRIADPHNPLLTARRLRGVMAHELGHLNGLAHCGARACVMHPVREVAELDSRPERPCGACPTRRRTLPMALAVAVCGVLFLTLDQMGATLKSDRSRCC